MRKITVDRIKCVGENLLIGVLSVIAVFLFFELGSLMIWLLLKSMGFWEAVIK